MDKSRDKVEAMFDKIAFKYDFLNHLFTMNLDRIWRKKIVKTIRKNGYDKDEILDIASGTGDLTKELLNLNPREIYSLDLSEKMLDIQRQKITDRRVKIMKGDVLKLPFEDESIDIATIGFGVRNFEKLPESLSEIRRVLRKGGKLIILEMFNKKGMVSGMFDFYFGKVIPLAGNKLSRSKAYDYLFKSVKSFYSVKDFMNLAKERDFTVNEAVNNFLGVVNTMYLSK